MYDTIITLKGGPVILHDEYGNEIKQYTDTEVFAIPRSVYKSEFYSAAQIGLHPSITFRLTTPEDYNNEKVLVHDNNAYTVIRVDWTAQRDYVDLICEERIGDLLIEEPTLAFINLTDEDSTQLLSSSGENIQGGFLVNS